MSFGYSTKTVTNNDLSAQFNKPKTHILKLSKCLMKELKGCKYNVSFSFKSNFGIILALGAWFSLMGVAVMNISCSKNNNKTFLVRENNFEQLINNSSD